MRVRTRLVSSAVFIAIGLTLLLVDTSGWSFFMVQALFWTMGVIFLIMGAAVWLYMGGDHQPPSRARGPTTGNERRAEARVEVGRDIDSIRLSGYPGDRRYFGGHDPRINPPKKK